MPQGPNLTGTAADNAGIGTAAWASPTNAQGAQNGTNATVTLTIGHGSHYLLCTGFGFSIPTGATIQGILVEVFGSDGSSGDGHTAQLFKAGVAAGTPIANTMNAGVWTSDGGSANLWGTTWTPAQINASNFGVGIFCGNGGGISTENFSVDAVRITVTYTLSGTGSGAPGTLTLTAAAGSAAGAASGAGALNALTFTSLAGAGAGDASTSGAPGTLTFAALFGAASGAATAAAALGTQTLQVLLGAATGTVIVPVVAGAAVLGQFARSVTGHAVRGLAGHAATRIAGHAARALAGRIPRRTP